MPKFLIEGSCDGSIFAETVEAATQEEAEAFAIERLCEAWGEEYGPDTTLDDLGDSAMVSPYTADDYARDAGPGLLQALKLAVSKLEAIEPAARSLGQERAISEGRAAIAKALPQ